MPCTLKRAETLFYPVHLLYEPIIQVLQSMFSKIGPCDAVCAGQIHSIAWAAITLTSIYLLVHKLLDSVVAAFLPHYLRLSPTTFGSFQRSSKYMCPSWAASLSSQQYFFYADLPLSSIERIALCSVLWALSIFYHQATSFFLFHSAITCCSYKAAVPGRNSPSSVFCRAL